MGVQSLQRTGKKPPLDGFEKHPVHVCGILVLSSRSSPASARRRFSRARSFSAYSLAVLPGGGVCSAHELVVFIPPGTFRMGSPTNEVDRCDREGPQTAVTISRGFWMGKYEVTQGEYLAVMGSNPSYFNAQTERDRLRHGPEPSGGDGELGRCHELLWPAHAAGAGGGADCDQQCVSAADGGGVGVCVPGVDLDAVQLWG